MSYSPARLEGKLEADVTNAPPTPSWFPEASDNEKAEQLIARYRERAAITKATKAIEDEDIAAYRQRIEAKLKESRRSIDPIVEEAPAIATPRQPRAAIAMNDDHIEVPRMAKRLVRRKKPVWPRYLMLGVCAMVIGTSLGYGVARMDQITAFITHTSQAATAKLAALSQPLPQAPAANSTGSSTVQADMQVTQQKPMLQPVVMTEPSQPVVAPPAIKLADASQNPNQATALPDPVSPGDNFVSKADGLMAQGDVASARQLYLQADGLGNAKGTFGVARSYDPKVFAQLNITGLQPDATKAADWYKKAASEGVTAQ